MGKKLFIFGTPQQTPITSSSRIDLPGGRGGGGGRARGRGGAREKVRGGCFDLAANVSWMSLVFNISTLS